MKWSHYQNKILLKQKYHQLTKKQFQSDAQEILDNFIKAKLVTKDTEFHVVKNSLRHVFSAIANGEGNANYNKVKKYMPKNLTMICTTTEKKIHMIVFGFL